MGLLATIFTIALTFLTVEIPFVLNSLLRGLFPDITEWAEPERVESFLKIARPIGYSCLGAVIILIVVGFKKGKENLSRIGSIALFLPTFGYFVAGMFFLAGSGVLRVL